MLVQKESSLLPQEVCYYYPFFELVLFIVVECEDNL